MSVLIDLIAARSLVNTPRKWGQGLPSFDGYRGRFCMAGAIHQVTDVLVMKPGNAYNLAWRALSRALPDSTKICNGRKSVPDFNDHPNTTFEMMLEAFDRAIDNERRSNDHAR